MYIAIFSHLTWLHENMSFKTSAGRFISVFWWCAALSASFYLFYRNYLVALTAIPHLHLYSPWKSSKTKFLLIKDRGLTSGSAGYELGCFLVGPPWRDEHHLGYTIINITCRKEIKHTNSGEWSKVEWHKIYHLAPLSPLNARSYPIAWKKSVCTGFTQYLENTPVYS